ncbi:hypothetical protein HY441_01115 [Candidatus Microgenomates bacterium]|nr:hypothetical protein [Candidatus Microgenomates bacterium]
MSEFGFKSRAEYKAEQRARIRYEREESRRQKEEEKIRQAQEESRRAEDKRQDEQTLLEIVSAYEDSITEVLTAYTKSVYKPRRARKLAVRTHIDYADAASGQYSWMLGWGRVSSRLHADGYVHENYREIVVFNHDSSGDRFTVTAYDPSWIEEDGLRKIADYIERVTGITTELDIYKPPAPGPYSGPTPTPDPGMGAPFG